MIELCHADSRNLHCEEMVFLAASLYGVQFHRLLDPDITVMFQHVNVE